MEFLADVLLVASAAGCGLYCFVLSRKLSRLSTLDSDMGQAIALLSRQVDDLSATLERAQTSVDAGAAHLEGLTTRAQETATRLELLLASMHDVSPHPTGPRPPADQPENSTFVRHARKG